MSDLDFYNSYDSIMKSYCSSEFDNDEFRRLMFHLLSLAIPNQACLKCDCSDYGIEDTRLFFDNDFFNVMSGK